MDEERPPQVLEPSSIDDEELAEDLTEGMVEDSDELPEEDNELEHPDDSEGLSDDDHEYSRS
jgi:hypothetical protein